MLALTIILGMAALADRLPTELFDYLLATQGQAEWELVSEYPFGAAHVSELFLRSQLWQGVPWEHRLTVCRPPEWRWRTWWCS